MTTPLVCARLLTRSGAGWLLRPCLGPARGLLAAAIVLAVVVATAVPAAAQAGAPRDQTSHDPGSGTEPEATVSAPSSPGDGLLPLASASLVQGEVQVAGSIERATVHQLQVDGETVYGFELFDAAGGRLSVTVRGALPEGFDEAGVALVSGSMADGRLLASQILLPGAPSSSRDQSRGLTGVMVISLIVWAGLFIYVFRVDRRVHRMEVS